MKIYWNNFRIFKEILNLQFYIISSSNLWKISIGLLIFEYGFLKEGLYLFMVKVKVNFFDWFIKFLKIFFLKV